MNKNRPHVAQLLVMVVFALTSFALLLFFWSSFGGSVPLRAKQYQVTVDFRQGSQLTGYADVRISGVSVGKAIKVVRPSGRSGVTRVTLAIEPKYAPLPADTRATLRTKTLIGETFIALSYGRRGGPRIADGGRIPDRQVVESVEIDRLADAFDAPTRKNLRRVLSSSASALRGNGPDMNAAAGEFGPTLESADGLLRVLDRQSREVSSGTRDLGTAFSTIGERSGATQELIRSADAALGATGRVGRSLGATLDALPEFMVQARQTVNQVRATSKVARPVVADLRPVTPLVRPALNDVREIAPQLRDTLRDVRPALPRVDRGLPRLREVVNTLGPAMDVLDPVTADLQPVSAYLKAYRRELLVTFANTAAAEQASARDSNGKQRKYLRFLPVVSDDVLVSSTTRLPTTRSNPYPRPGELEDFPLKSFSCDHLQNNGAPLSAVLGLRGNVPCRVQSPYVVDGRPMQFPRLEEAPPVTGTQTRTRDGR
jgi:virulence factor Mce-like protein